MLMQKEQKLSPIHTKEPESTIHNSDSSMEQYVFSDKTKRLTFVLMAIGVIALIGGIVMAFASGGEHGGDHGHHGWGQRIWSNLLINGFYFFGIALAATFFLAVQYAAHAGWSVVFKRLFEALSSYMPVGAVVLFLVFITGTFHLHHLYHWMDPAVYDLYLLTDGTTSKIFEDGAVMNPSYDALIAGKSAYLNQGFFWVRAIAFVAIYIFFANRFRKRSLEEDLNGSQGVFKRNVVDAAIFLVLFGFTSMVLSWDWIMSIDTHWFSTIFGWYVFSGMWVGAMIMVTLLTLHLKKLGLLKSVNDSHIHDMGKWMFAVSFLWSYLFFCQFMLIWYSNIPEEVTYYQARFEDYKVLFWVIFFMNMVFPMLLLMSRDTKRNTGFLTIVGCIIFVGHWLDTYMMITPGTMGTHGHLSFFEIGLGLGFLGVFLFVVLRTLSKAPVMVKNHPYLDESVHHHI